MSGSSATAEIIEKIKGGAKTDSLVDYLDEFDDSEE